jgi:hypothetical protein
VEHRPKYYSFRIVKANGRKRKPRPTSTRSVCRTSGFVLVGNLEATFETGSGRSLGKIVEGCAVTQAQSAFRIEGCSSKRGMLLNFDVEFKIHQ